MGEKKGLIKWFSEVKKEDYDAIGKRGAIIGELYSNKFTMPSGFVISYEAYRKFMSGSGLREKINFMLEDLNIGDSVALKNASQKIIESIEKTEFPAEVEEEIKEAYEFLDVDKEVINAASEGALSILKNSREPVFVSIRKSVDEKFEEKNKSEKNDLFLNIKGYRDLLQDIKKLYAQSFRENEIYYRVSNKINNIDFDIAVVVQKMINSDKSGVAYSYSKIPNSNNMIINAIWGLGAGIQVGLIPDTYILNRENMEILSHEISSKEFALTRDSSGSTCKVKLTPERAVQQTLTNHEIKLVSQLVLKVEECIKKPQKVEFCTSNGEIFVLDSEDLELKNSQYKKDKELENEDIEKKILKELEAGEYRPGGIKEKDQDVPKLNDAILVEEQQDLDDEVKVDLV